jgi:hypothetical protein
VDQQRRQIRSARWRVPLSMLALACAALTMAACSSSPPPRQVASLPGHSGGAAGPRRTLTTAQSDRDMIRFTRCLRAHGLQVPDPYHRPGHAGLSIDIPSQTATNRAAFTACNHFIEAIIQMKESGATSQAAPHMRQLTQYARCMRGHDIPMLDPTSYGALNLGRVPGITSNYGRYSPQFRAADATCRHYLPAGVHDDGTGP